MRQDTATTTWISLAAFYAALFAALAVLMQFLPVWLHDQRRLGEGQIAVVLSCMTVARTLAGPLWAREIDRSGRPRAVLIGLSAASLVLFCGFHAVESTPALAAVSFLFGCAYPPMHPIVDGFASGLARRFSFAYGRLRMVGSVTFLAAVLGVGWWLESSSSAIVFPLVVGMLAVLAVVAFGLPRDAVSGHVPAKAPMTGLLRSRPFMLLLVAAAVVQGSHAPYYNLSTLHWQEHGIGKATAGMLWAEGVFAEIVLFWFARGTVDRLRPTTLLAIGGAAAAVRWTVLGLTTDVALLVATNWLHALTFTCTYLGSLRALDRRVAPGQRMTAQGLLGAATSGVGMVAGSLLGGFLYERVGAGAFLAMALWGVVGVLLALHLRRLADRIHSSDTAAADASPE